MERRKNEKMVIVCASVMVCMVLWRYLDLGYGKRREHDRMTRRYPMVIVSLM